MGIANDASGTTKMRLGAVLCLALVNDYLTATPHQFGECTEPIWGRARVLDDGHNRLVIGRSRLQITAVLKRLALYPIYGCNKKRWRSQVSCRDMRISIPV